MIADNYLKAKDMYFELKDLIVRCHNKIEDNRSKPFIIESCVAGLAESIRIMESALMDEDND